MKTFQINGQATHHFLIHAKDGSGVLRTLVDLGDGTFAETAESWSVRAGGVGAAKRAYDALDADPTDRERRANRAKELSSMRVEN